MLEIYSVSTDCFFPIIFTLRITNLETMHIFSIPIKKKVKK